MLVKKNLKPGQKLKDFKDLNWYMLHTNSFVVPYYDDKADMFDDWIVLRIWKDTMYRIHVDIAYSEAENLRRKYVRS